MKIYYARPLNIYNTLQDNRDIELLKNLGFELVNPNKQELIDRYHNEGMSVFYEAITDCDALAFRSFPDLKISAGVFGEINKARELEKLIIELPTITTSRALSIDDTKEYLKLLGNR